MTSNFMLTGGVGNFLDDVWQLDMIFLYRFTIVLFLLFNVMAKPFMHICRNLTPQARIKLINEREFFGCKTLNDDTY